MTDFTSLNLAAPLGKALAASGYTSPTPIQSQAIPKVLAGHDLLGIAQTGTGKTAAFALPILNHLLSNPGTLAPRSTRVLVLAPTRELASQIAASFRTYGEFMKLSVATVFGGIPINRQIREMQRGVDVLVATPGRLIDLIQQKALTLKDVEILVLDEADQMLDMGFIHSLRKIVPMVPKNRQTLFFSATMPKPIADLAAQFLTNPEKVSVAPQATTAERVDQQQIVLNQNDKQALLTMILRDTPFDRALIFMRTKHGSDRVVKNLIRAGIEAAAIHGNKSQPQRERTLAAFRNGSLRVLVATDIAARGIDIDGVSHVINFEIPNVPEQYVHRIGRTARAGRDGIALSFVAGEERKFMRDIEKVTKQRIPMADLPEGFDKVVAEIAALPPLPKREPQQGRGGQGRGGQGRGGQGRGDQGRSGAGRSGEGRSGEGRGNGRSGGGNSRGNSRDNARDDDPRYADRKVSDGGANRPKGARNGDPRPPRTEWTSADAGLDERGSGEKRGANPQRKHQDRKGKPQNKEQGRSQDRSEGGNRSRSNDRRNDTVGAGANDTDNHYQKPRPRNSQSRRAKSTTRENA